MQEAWWLWCCHLAQRWKESLRLLQVHPANSPAPGSQRCRGQRSGGVVRLKEIKASSGSEGNQATACSESHETFHNQPPLVRSAANRTCCRCCNCTARGGEPAEAFRWNKSGTQRSGAEARGGPAAGRVHPGAAWGCQTPLRCAAPAARPIQQRTLHSPRIKW